MIGEILLDIQAVKLDPENPFTWASGIKSPIYCDNRQIIGHPRLRARVVDGFCERVRSLEGVDLIVGTATAGIPWASWVADRLELPMAYARSGKKEHGLRNVIEGSSQAGSRAVLIEDLISTGKSAIEAAQKLTEASIEVIETVSIFNYGFEKARRNFESSGFNFYSLENLDSLLETAQSKGLLSNEQIGIIHAWKLNTDRS